MSQKAHIIQAEDNDVVFEENKKNDIVEKYKELNIKCDSIIEKISKKKSKKLNK